MPLHTWRIDNSHKRFNVGLSNPKKARPDLAERYVYMGDEIKVIVEAVGACRHTLDSDFFVLDLDETLYILSF